MGNRAVITTSTGWSDIQNSTELGVYLHWNGGRDSVEAFLTYCKLRGFRPPETDCYGWARLCQVIANFFGGDGLSIGIDKCCNLDCDNWDNGVYIIKNWEIVGREYFEGVEQNAYDLTEMLLEIDECQPEQQRLGEEFITALVVPTSELKIGDIVFVNVFDGYRRYKVVGFGEDTMVNGTNVKGMPYVDLYGNIADGYAWNINNYIRTETARVAR